MDYKYIEQLLERYFQCETTLEEEDILRTFFSQEDVPVWLTKYQSLFAYQAQHDEVLGDEFDERVLAAIKEEEPVKARSVSFTHYVMPLFKAAAVVAIVLTLGNAAQAPWDRGWDNPQEEFAKYHERQMNDSLNMMEPVQAENILSGDSAKQVQKATPKY
jgi:hypothetical protein